MKILFAILNLACLSASASSTSDVHATWVNHPVTYTFVNADGTPVTGATVISRESVIRKKCKFSISVCGGGCSEVERSENMDRPGVTDSEGKVTFSYDWETLINEIRASSKLKNMALRPERANIDYVVEVLSADGNKFQCLFAADPSLYSNVPQYTGAIWWIPSFNSTATPPNEYTCHLK